MVSSNPHLWVVVLAAGEGTRVSNLTRDRGGLPAPKQYSSIDGRTTLIETTLERAKRIAHCDRIVVVVARQHRRWWTEELAGIPPGNVIPQPENRGTAAGILLPLLWITRRDPDARLVILPSDHGVSREDILHRAIIDAIAVCVRSGLGMVLLGVRPKGPETDYGWILPRSGGRGRLRPVVSFREKPDAATAAALLAAGGMLNSLILVAGGRFLLSLFETVLPRLWHSLQGMLHATRDGPLIRPDLVDLYRSVPALDFSKHLLERVATDLWVQAVPECGWLDLGTPERLTGALMAHGRQCRESATPQIDHRLPQPPRAHFGAPESTQSAVHGTATAVS